MHPAPLRRRAFLRLSGLGVVASLLPLDGASADGAPKIRFVAEFGKHGSGKGEFRSPVSIGIDSADRLYVTDFLNNRVQSFSTEGDFLHEFAAAPHPGGLAVHPNGTVYVAHWNEGEISAHTSDGELICSWGGKGTGDGQFNLTGGLAVAPDGHLYACDHGNSRIQVFSSDGKFVRHWGSQGAGPGQFGHGKSPGSRFAGPQMVAVDHDGFVYATDAASGRVQKFTPEGKCLLTFGDLSGNPGGFGGRKDPPVQGPIGVCVDRMGRIWVGATNHRVQLFSPTGEHLATIGAPGSAPGEFDTPHGLVLDSKGFLYVVDTMNARVQKFAVE